MEPPGRDEDVPDAEQPLAPAGAEAEPPGLAGPQAGMVGGGPRQGDALEQQQQQPPTPAPPAQDAFAGAPPGGDQGQGSGGGGGGPVVINNEPAQGNPDITQALLDAYQEQVKKMEELRLQQDQELRKALEAEKARSLAQLETIAAGGSSGPSLSKDVLLGGLSAAHRYNQTEEGGGHVPDPGQPSGEYPNPNKRPTPGDENDMEEPLEMMKRGRTPMPRTHGGPMGSAPPVSAPPSAPRSIEGTTPTNQPYTFAPEDISQEPIIENDLEEVDSLDDWMDRNDCCDEVREALKGINAKLDASDARIIAMQATIAGLATQASVDGIRDTIAGLSTQDSVPRLLRKFPAEPAIFCRKPATLGD